MLWEENKREQPFVVPDDIADLSFKIDCKQIALDHAHDLSLALHQALPWLADEERAGVHLIHGASSGNGWQRPEEGDGDDFIYLSRRSRMMLRLPKHRFEDARSLVGQTLEVAENSIIVGDYQVKPFSSMGTLFARYILLEDNESEDQLIARLSSEMKAMGITLRKALCGIGHEFKLPEGRVRTMSVMVADLDPEEAVILQTHGIGGGRKMGFGLFIPHKGIKPVGDMSETSHFSGAE
ncbi:MAG: type I-MYXAN CRISPR-associated protein Cas6/Cmx6 [Gammaproteobacteria bacterium]|nr:type I-MYXAN CRISPR-associated protein Cas6/Cmx6 [Gammaproteobacteria bacterium]